ncbi:MAG TPA: bifunctional (p)ppGpp synthetase/guanosine-3',5'-bis(diphosphate) 3'-pyrophosphohydrolase [Vicinamibacterales bacterium]|nr:bifunctional (p)ppGpp synthetase/guanosine-3',5'-bis(diphosphate) 3'-pyrophosphohydrolase [Vicinamibacterales bacterium]
MIRFEDLLEKVRGYSPDADLELLRRAYVFSALEHKGQVRHSGEPYLVHPLEVADILADMKLDVVCVASGLLHDVVEDTLTTIERIGATFGDEIAHIVEGVTKISTMPEFSTSEERQVENFRKMLLAMVDDIRVILVKLADRLHNMRTLQYMSDDRRVRTAQETLDIYAPIANRLGMAKMKNELEELSFKYLEPTAYESLHTRVEGKRRATEGVIEDLLAEIRAKLQDAQVPVIRIDGRIKRLFSIWLKLKRQKIDLEQVYDFVALRIVTQSVKDCYAALGIIHQTWSPVPGRIKDLIAMPRPNGYQSLHTSVISDHGFPFEVQIRTEEMDSRAEEGIAAHWKYKEGRVGAGRDEQYFQWLRQLLEWQQEVRDPQEFLANLKIDLYPEEVYTFTPRGQVKVLPRGSTPVDFAYSIHTDVGHQCVGARVNGRMVPLRTKLKNGDIVEILTTVGHKPSRDWLNFAATSRARQRIKHLIQAEEKERSIELGRKLVEKEARRYDLNMTKLLDPERLAKVAHEFGFQNDELFAQIGYGKVSVRQVLDKLVPQGELKEKVPDHPVVSAVKRALTPTAATTDRIVVRGIDDLMVFRARCCNPIRGEKIIGYITRGKGVSVHSEKCSNVLNLQYDPERRIEVEWDKGTDVAPYTVRLTMQVEDRKGMIAELSSRIADINTNIINLEATARAEDHQARIDMTVEIQDVKHLERVIKSIRGVEGVLGVERSATR